MPNHLSRSYNYHYDDERDPFVYPGTHVLVNNFGLTNIDELSTVERQITGAAYAKLEQQPIDGNFDLNHLQAIHKALFEEIYAWAGCIREKGFISKGNSLFCAAELIVPYSNELFRKLKSESLLTGLDRKRFIERIAFYIAEINALHPFREGNGRTQRIFANQLARQAGWNLNLTRIAPDKLCDAYIESMTDDTALIALLDQSVEPTLSNG